MTSSDIEILEIHSHSLWAHILRLIEKERFIDAQNTLILNTVMKNLEWALDEIRQTERRAVE